MSSYLQWPTTTSYITSYFMDYFTWTKKWIQHKQYIRVCYQTSIVFLAARMQLWCVAIMFSFKTARGMCGWKGEHRRSHQSLFTGLGEQCLLHMYKVFYGSRQSCMKSDKVSHMMSLEAVLVWTVNVFLKIRRCGL